MKTGSCVIDGEAKVLCQLDTWVVQDWLSTLRTVGVALRDFDLPGLSQSILAIAKDMSGELLDDSVGAKE